MCMVERRADPDTDLQYLSDRKRPAASELVREGTAAVPRHHQVRGAGRRDAVLQDGHHLRVPPQVPYRRQLSIEARADRSISGRRQNLDRHQAAHGRLPSAEHLARHARGDQHHLCELRQAGQQADSQLLGGLSLTQHPDHVDSVPCMSSRLCRDTPPRARSVLVRIQQGLAGGSRGCRPGGR